MHMKVVFMLVLIGLGLRAHCQAKDEIYKLANQGQTAKAMEMASDVIKTEADAGMYHLIGRMFVDDRRCDTAISFLQKAIDLDHDASWVSGWSHVYLGKAYFMTGKKDAAISELKYAIAIHKTDNSVSVAQNMLVRIDDKRSVSYTENDSEPKWIKIEKEHITYNFQDTAGMRLFPFEFMKQHEEAYEKINKTFQAKLPRKLVFYVWTDAYLAKKLLHRDLGFTDPINCICNVRIDQTVGHEMTHALSYWGWGTPPANGTQFINEGVAVAFDQEGYDRYEKAMKSVEGQGYHSVLDIWKETRSDLAYPVGGAFVGYLFEKSTPAQFKSVIKDQTIDNAEKVYGLVAFNALIADFNKKIGLQ